MNPIFDSHDDEGDVDDLENEFSYPQENSNAGQEMACKSCKGVCDAWNIWTDGCLS